MKHGKGKLLWDDGSYYNGDFKNNKFEGNGTYIWTDGRNYNGSWSNNLINGVGTMSYPVMQ